MQVAGNSARPPKCSLAVMARNILYTAALATGLFLGVTAPSVYAQDRSSSQPTADQAKNNVSDRQIMQNIRKSVIADKSLSTEGHNAKIIAQHGKVTLRGRVHSEDERRNIEGKATDIAGAGNVDNQLTVRADK